MEATSRGNRMDPHRTDQQETGNTHVATAIETQRDLALNGAPLRIARLQEHCTVLGPGRRAVVWFQGCRLSCPGCIAAEMNSAPPLLTTTPGRLAAWCLSIENIDGLTLSGGDPIDQPLDALATFLEAVRTAASLGVMLYTGRTLAQLRASVDPSMPRVLAATDILIDGPYVEALNDGIGWRGSSNQTVHRLGQRSHGAERAATETRRLELSVDAAGTVGMAGLPQRGRGSGLADRLAAAAGSKGVTS